MDCMQSCLYGCSYFSSHPGQKNILLFRRFLSWARWLSNSKPILELLFWPVRSFALLSLITFKSEFLNGERVIICDRLADLPLLMAAFDFGTGEMFDGEILAPSAFAVLPSGGEIFLRLFEYVWAGYFSRYSDWLRAGRSEIESWWGRDLPPVQTGPGAYPASCKMGTESFPGVKCGRGVLLTTHPLVVPRSWNSRAIPLPTLWATPGLWRDHFTFLFEYVLPSAAFFTIDTGICNSLLVSPGGSSFKFLWGRIITSDGRKSS